jgi:hypothetical protein
MERSEGRWRGRYPDQAFPFPVRPEGMVGVRDGGRNLVEEIRTTSCGSGMTLLRIVFTSGIRYTNRSVRVVPRGHCRLVA